jgi:gas vesicle protein
VTTALIIIGVIVGIIVGVVAALMWVGKQLSDAIGRWL